MFNQLVNTTSSVKEKELLLTAVTDITKRGYIDSDIISVYEALFPHKEAPFYPFLERCNLPVLHKTGDIIRYKGNLYQIQTVPIINEYCDFSDECYLCFPINGTGHKHIHLGYAERLNEE